MLVMHPSHTADLLRLAVNQQNAASASAAAYHLHKLSNKLLAENKQQLLEQLAQPRLQGTDIARMVHEALEPQQRELVRRHQQQQQQVTPQLLQELLLLAAARQHWALMQELLDMLPAVSMQLPSSTVAELLRSVIRSRFRHCPVREVLVASLCQLPAAAELTAAEVSSLIRQALGKRQLNCASELAILLEARQDFRSSHACHVLMPAICSSWLEGLEWMEAGGVLLVLEPEHTEQLINQASLTATLAGAGMLPAWCDLVASAGSSSLQDALPPELAVLKMLLANPAVNQLQQKHVRRLLLAAAALGNAGALALLLSVQGAAAAVDGNTCMQLLGCAVQFRSSAVVQLLVPTLQPDPFKGGWFEITAHALADLLRAGDLAMLQLVAKQLAAAVPSTWVCSVQGTLLMLAGQLGRCSSIRVLCAEQTWWARYTQLSPLTWEELEQLLGLAVRKNSPSTVQCLLQHPVAGELPEDIVQRVTQQEQQRQQAFAAATGPLESHKPLQQQQQLTAKAKLDRAALLHAMQAGHLPCADAHAMLPPASCATAEGTPTQKDLPWVAC
jgi:hypothetical protein